MRQGDLPQPREEDHQDRPLMGAAESFCWQELRPGTPGHIPVTIEQLRICRSPL